jgi:hypothetical protein
LTYRTYKGKRRPAETLIPALAGLIAAAQLVFCVEIFWSASFPRIEPIGTAASMAPARLILTGKRKGSR